MSIICTTDTLGTEGFAYLARRTPEDCWHIKRHISSIGLIGVPTVGLAAHETLIDVLCVTGEDVVLINAAAGGVGHIAVPLASGLGGQVLGAASQRNHHFVAGLGAAAVNDYDAGDVAKAIRAQYLGGLDTALNCVSGMAANVYVAALKDGGKMVDLPGAVSAH
jgi:NADPH:quinone reductase-like Zn-dependent oxidoreductase